MNTSFDANNINEIKKWLGSGSINIFGMPFSGKDTQCQKLSEILDANTFGGGDILRNSSVSEKLKTDIDNGLLAPSDEYKEKVIPYFNKQEFKDKPLILSSVGRWIGEESSVIKAANASNHPIKTAIFLKLSRQESLKRKRLANRGRADDDESKLDNRFNEYQNKTYPVLDVYRSKNLLIEIDGNKSEINVTKSIIEQLYIKAKEEQ